MNQDDLNASIHNLASPGPENGPPPPGWSHEEIAQNKALAQEISEIKNPERRAEAQRLLAGIKGVCSGYV